MPQWNAACFYNTCPTDNNALDFQPQLKATVSSSEIILNQKKQHVVNGWRHSVYIVLLLWGKFLLKILLWGIVPVRVTCVVDAKAISTWNLHSSTWRQILCILQLETKFQSQFQFGDFSHMSGCWFSLTRPRELGDGGQTEQIMQSFIAL